MQQQLQKIETRLNEYYIERQEEIHGISLGLLSGANVLFLGPPGVAKSAIIQDYTKMIHSGKCFTWQLTKFSTPEELLGPYSMSELENDRFTRVTKGKLPEAHLAFLDETFKGNSGILNTLLGIMNERIFYDDGKRIDIPLLTLIGASNELPEEGDDLEAVLDRFVIKHMLRSIEEPSNFSKMLELPDKCLTEPIVSLEEIHTMKTEVPKVVFNQEAVDGLTQLRGAINKEGIAVSDRTYMIARQILKAEAYYHERQEVTPEDFEILQHCLWPDPDVRGKVLGLILSAVNPEKSKIAELIEDTKDLYARYSAIPEDEEEKVKQGYEVVVKLRDAKKTLRSFHKDLARHGRDPALAIQGETAVEIMLESVYQSCGVTFEAPAPQLSATTKSTEKSSA